MKYSVLMPCTKGFLLFFLLQTSLFLLASAQTDSTNSTTMPDIITPNATSWTNLTLNSTVAPSANLTNTTTLGTNVTTSAMVSCRVFSCNYSACYSTFMSSNVTICSASGSFCELRRDGDALYSVSCTSSCLSACANTSQNNCSINCCTNNCDNSTINSLLNSSVIMTTTTTAATTTTSTTKASTIASTAIATNGKKCQKFSCNGDGCYQGNTNVGLCGTGQNFCMLKKTPTGTLVTWTASCIEDCSKEIVCTSTNTICILECCNATTTASCLKLNGQTNVLGSGTMAPCCHLPLLVSSFLLWLLMIGKSAD
ncbi:cell wall integrity and stress response component 4 isoform X2 [Tachysurus fulvidraco]|uniref:cell wall integrity and stress response component 4 isoform X2 n=1 Tax=Tachysurus fulvidraco TaxID=1234273 RepID=UPI000F5029FB|nr:cell wall integrity and stress response component 4 isoform X2 [Tachysurus fulvidraco]